MSTNYYLRNNICECCNRYDSEHLWKSSWWWDFAIHHIDEKFNSWNEFLEYTKKWKIFDEYWEEISHNDFIDIIEFKKNQYPFAHRKENDPYAKYIDWYCFIKSDFS